VFSAAAASFLNRKRHLIFICEIRNFVKQEKYKNC